MAEVEDRYHQVSWDDCGLHPITRWPWFTVCHTPTAGALLLLVSIVASVFAGYTFHIPSNAKSTNLIGLPTVLRLPQVFMAPLPIPRARLRMDNLVGIAHSVPDAPAQLPFLQSLHLLQNVQQPRAGSAIMETSSPDGLARAVDQLRQAKNVMVLSGAGMSTAAGIPDFRSPGGLYGSSASLLEKFTYINKTALSPLSQRQALESDIKNALTLQFFRINPLPYHEMRRGLILGLADGQWKPTIGHVLPEILNRNGKLRTLASQNIDGLDHQVVTDKKKLYNPHGLISWLVSEPLRDPLSMDRNNSIYRRYVELVKSNIKDIYAELPARQGKSRYKGPDVSTPITLEMFGDLLPARFKEKSQAEARDGLYSVKPGSVQFDTQLWTTNAAGEKYDAFSDVSECDMMLVMGTSLSGLTIDQLAYAAGSQGKPLLVFDMARTPVESCQQYGAWTAQRDTLLQGPIDQNVLLVLDRLGWLRQVFDFLPNLCLSSLKTLREFMARKTDQRDFARELEELERAIHHERAREMTFYGDDPSD